MAGKLGPQFALRGYVRKDWMLEGNLAESYIVLQLNDFSTVMLETYSESFRHELISLGEELSPWIFCAQIIREDGEQIFAFRSALERAFFDELKELNSVGPKTAASVVGRLGVENLFKLHHGDSLKNYKISGMGPKTIEKIVKMVREQEKKFEPLFHLSESER